MPNYVQKKLTEYGHKAPKRRQYCPYEPNPIKYGKDSDKIAYEKPSDPLDETDQKKYVQRVLGSFLYYARVIDLTILHALSAIASEQAKPTEKNVEKSPSIPRLHAHQSKRSNTIPSIRYDTERTLQCKLLVSGKRSKPGRRIFFPRQTPT